jgi:hypothetical protein
MSGRHVPRGSAGYHQLSVSAPAADAFAVEHTLSLLQSPGEADSAIARLHAVRDETAEELAHAEAEVARLDAILAAQRTVFASLTPEQAAGFILTHQGLQADRTREAARAEELRAAEQHSASLVATLSAAVNAARARSSALEATRAAPAKASSKATFDALGHAIMHGGVVVYPPAMEGGSPTWFTRREAEALTHFAEASKVEQRTVLRALEARVVVQVNTDAEAAQSAMERHQRRRADNLHYALPLAEPIAPLSENGDTVQAGHTEKQPSTSE